MSSVYCFSGFARTNSPTKLRPSRTIQTSIPGERQKKIYRPKVGEPVPDSIDVWDRRRYVLRPHLPLVQSASSTVNISKRVSKTWWIDTLVLLFHSSLLFGFRWRVFFHPSVSFHQFAAFQTLPKLRFVRFDSRPSCFCTEALNWFSLAKIQ